MYWRKCGHCEHCLYDSDADGYMCEVTEERTELRDESCEHFKEDDPYL